MTCEAATDGAKPGTRVAIICGAGIVSGKEIMALELGEGLRACGCPVTYVTSQWGNGDFSVRLKALGFPFRRMRLGFISATLTWDCLRMTADQLCRWPKLLWDYTRFLREDKPSHVVHTNWHHLLVLWPLLRRERDLFWVHDVVLDRPQYRRVFHFLGRRLGGFVAASHAVGRSLAAAGIPRERVRVIHNGLALPERSVAVPSQPADAPVRVGIVGQIGAWKGHEDLLAAFGRLATQHPLAELHVFGRGEEAYVAALRRQTEALQLTGRVFWRGFEPDRAKAFQALDLCVMPSRVEEAFGLIAVEAGLFGLPVIASRRGALPEIVEDGVTGRLCDAENPADLAAKLEELLRDPALRKRLGAAGRQRAETYFSRRRMVEDFLRVLGETDWAPRA